MTEFALSLDRNHWNPLVGCFIDQGERAGELRSAGIPIIQFPIRSFASLSTFSAFAMMRSVIRKHKIIVAHAFDAPMNIFAVPAAYFSSCPVVLSSQRAHRSLSSPHERFLLRLTDRFADGVVVNCDALRRHMAEDEGLPPDKTYLCYNGIRTDIFFPKSQPRPPALADATLVIGTLCVLRPEKGLSTLLKAFAAVQHIRTGMKLAIVGSGPELGSLQSQASELGIADSVHFEPATKNVTDWLRAMDIFVLPSLSEALSNSLMEAMLCGCAAVASNTGGNPELIANGTTGLLFTRGDAAELSSCLLSLITNGGRRRDLAAAGMRFIKEQFPMQKSVARMIAIYRELLAQKELVVE